MILDLFGAKFDIHMEDTLAYYAVESQERCNCAYCRNFSAAVDKVYPSLRPFLVQFGVDIDAPVESMPFDQPNEIWYENVYSVCGQILTGETSSFFVEGVEIRVHSENSLDVNSNCPAPCFYLSVGMMVLPWVLTESMSAVVSPANEPSFMRKMWNRLLGKVKDTEPLS